MLGTTSTAGDSAPGKHCSAGEGGVRPRREALLEPQEFRVTFEGLAATLEIARMRQGRPPVIGESLEMGERKRAQVLSRKGQDAVLAERVEKNAHLIGPQRRAQIDPADAQARAADRQRTFTAHVRAKPMLQSFDDSLTHPSWTR